MSGPPMVKSMNFTEPEARPVLGPAGNKASSVELRKPVLKLKCEKTERPPDTDEAKGNKSPAALQSPEVIQEKLPSPVGFKRNVSSAASILRQRPPNLSLNASCSSDASTDSSHSRASTGRILRRSFTSTPSSRRKQQCSSKGERIEKVEGNGKSVGSEIDGVVLMVLWSRKVLDRDVFLDFDPTAVSKLNDKKIATPGSPASSLLSEVKLRAIVENARQICKIINEHGSFDKYIWGFVNYKPIVGNFRYPRQVPIKTSKADTISKDLVRRGFRGVGPTVVYSFMQVAGITNDHLINCFRFRDCVIAGDLKDKDEGVTSQNEANPHDDLAGLARDIDDLNLSR
ncbi:hypothetical protein DH2020_038365 [Rehmannia glutinosa]|uniref:Uncharacterized protein n=1 Tax=Rehmannia glutinosa TaxID=99300 RepID=A0ABR0UZY8_REHGL